MKQFILIFNFLFSSLLGAKGIEIPSYEWKKMESISEGIVTATKRIILADFPKSFNPSILKWENGYLLSFRYCPNRAKLPWFSYIGVVLLDENFNLLSIPQLLSIRPTGCKIPSQSEDAKLFEHKGRIFLTYNDSLEKIFPSSKERRDIYVAEIEKVKGNFIVLSTKKLIHKEKYSVQFWQKNWVPFTYQNDLFIGYSIQPHEILRPNFSNGICDKEYETTASIVWPYGLLRGSTPPLLDGDEYLAFFHSGMLAKSDTSSGKEKWHYFMGAYTFAAHPPFELNSISPCPIIGSDFYKNCATEKNVIFPGGYVISGDNLHVAYGKNDDEIWIATLNKHKLKESLVHLSGK